MHYSPIAARAGEAHLPPPTPGTPVSEAAEQGNDEGGELRAEAKGTREAEASRCLPPVPHHTKLANPDADPGISNFLRPVVAT